MSQPIPAHIVQLMHSARIQGRGEEYLIAGPSPIGPRPIAAAGFLIASRPVVRAGANRWFKADIGAIQPICGYQAPTLDLQSGTTLFLKSSICSEKLAGQYRLRFKAWGHSAWLWPRYRAPPKRIQIGLQPSSAVAIQKRYPN